MIHTLELQSRRAQELIDLTAAVQDLVRQHGPLDGVCYLYVPHTTAGITINEHADPSVADDLLLALNQAVPAALPYRHAEGNSPAHVKASLIGTTAVVLVESGRLVLGTWQGIFFCEFDGPRRRRLLVKFLKD